MIDETVSFLKNSYIPLIMLSVGLITAVLESLRKANKKKKHARIFYIICSVICFSLFISITWINNSILGLGKVNHFRKALIHKNILFASDYIVEGSGTGGIRGSGGGKKYFHWRLHGLNLDTGKKIFRVFPNQSYQKIAGFTNELFIIERGRARFGMDLPYQADNYIAYDIQTGDEKFMLSEQFLEKNNPTFANLINGFTFKNEHFIVTSKDGEEFTLNNFNFKLSPIPLDSTKVFQPSNFMAEEEVDEGDTFTNLHGLKFSGDIRKQILDEKGNILNKKNFFIDGGFLQAFLNKKIITILSYTATDHSETIISGVFYNGKLAWQITELKNLSIEGSYSFSFIYNENLILIIGGTVLAIDPETGTINWRTDL